jgi:hypothetical protein
MKAKMPPLEVKPDKRSLLRCDSLLSRLVEKRSCIIRQLSFDWKEEMGYWRLLKNPKLSVNWLSEWVLRVSKAQICVTNRHVLSIQDSSTIGFQVRASQKQGLSAVGTVGDCPGFIVHPNLILDAQDGSCLGLGALSIFDQWVSKGAQSTVQHLASAEKKTGRWLESGKAARDFLKAAQTITHVADREADFYEMLLEFGQTRQKNEHLVVRVNDDRLLGHMEGRGKAKGKKGDEKVITTQDGQNIDIHFPYRAHLSDVVSRLPIQAQWLLKLQDNPKREAREAKVVLRYMSKVPIRRPTKLYKRTYEGEPLPFFLYINVIDLVEIIPDDATYTPIHWRIYTSHTLDNVEQAKQVIRHSKIKWAKFGMCISRIW